MRVQLIINLDQLTRNSGRYDNRPTESRWQASEWIAETLGLSVSQHGRLYHENACRVDCSAEQFVRFQLERCRRGYINRFRDLRVKVITDPPYKDVDLPLFVAQRECRPGERIIPKGAREQDVVVAKFDLSKFDTEYDDNFNLVIRRKK